MAHVSEYVCVKCEKYVLIATSSGEKRGVIENMLFIVVEVVKGGYVSRFHLYWATTAEYEILTTFGKFSLYVWKRIEKEEGIKNNISQLED